MSENHPPSVSVIVPTFGRHASVRRVLEALAQQDYPADRYEVLIVDTSPDDGVEEIVRLFQGTVPGRLIYLCKDPAGPAASRNLGIRHATGEIIAFTDSDCLPSPSWLRHLVTGFSDGVGIVQGTVRPDPAGKPGFLTYYPTVEAETCVYECANLAYRRDVLEQAGGFDENFRENRDSVIGGEDVDLAWRVKRMGWKSRFVPEALVYHEVRAISFERWLVIRPMLVWPLLVKRFPELRKFMFARYFYDAQQAGLVLGLLGSGLALLHPAALVLWIPYLLSRSAGRGRLLRGPLRPLKALVYLPRDLISFALLAWGSIRARTILL